MNEFEVFQHKHKYLTLRKEQQELLLAATLKENEGNTLEGQRLKRSAMFCYTEQLGKLAKLLRTFGIDPSKL